VLEQHGHGEEVVDRAVEEALDLRCVQVDAHDPVRPGRLEQVGDEPCRDRLATAALLVLAGVRVERRDDGDALRRGTLEGVDHDELLHEPLVDRRGVRLDDEGVTATDGLVEAGVELTVRERPGVGGDQVDAELLCDRRRELGVRSSRHEDESFLAGRLDSGHVSRSLPDPARGRCPGPRPGSSGDGHARRRRCHSPRARRAASAAGVPGRLSSTHPSVLRCGA
jgi:hypothetical protein